MPVAQRAELKAKISTVAAELFRSEGYHAISMRRIATEIGVTPMALYTYFPSKQAILVSLWADILDDVSRKMQACASKDDTPMGQLNAMAGAYVDYWLQHRDRYFLVFMSRGLDRSDVREFVTEGSAVEWFQALYDLIGLAMGRDSESRYVKARGDRLVCGLLGVVHATITIPGHDWTPVDDLVSGYVVSACTA